MHTWNWTCLLMMKLTFFGYSYSEIHLRQKGLNLIQTWTCRHARTCAHTQYMTIYLEDVFVITCSIMLSDVIVILHV